MNNSNEGFVILTNMIKSAVDDVMALDNALTDLKQETNNIDNIVRINGNDFTDYDKAIEYINKLKSKEVEKWYLHDVDLFGIGYAIMKWCQAKNVYYNENILKSALDEYSVKSGVIGSNFAKDVLHLYNKISSLPQFRGKRFEGLVR